MSQLFYLRRLDFLLRVYWLNLGEISKLEITDFFWLKNYFHSINHEMYLQNIYTKLLTREDFYFDGADVKLHCSCLPMGKLKRLFKAVALTILSQDSHIRLNAKSLKKVYQFYGITSFNNYSGLVDQDFTISEIISEIEPSQIQEHIIWVYFADINKNIINQVRQRFRPKNINYQLLTLLENLNLDNIVKVLLPLELPVTARLISSFSGVKYE